MVFNPTSGREPAAHREQAIRSAFDQAKMAVLWLPTNATDAGAGVTGQALRAGADLVAVAGGDGTVKACAAALAGTEVPMAVLPQGTGNLLARNLGIPARLRHAVEVALAGSRRRIDVGIGDAAVNGTTSFLVMAGVGFDAAMLRDTDPELKRRLGAVAYMRSGLAELRYPQDDYTLTLDGTVRVRRRASCVLVANMGRIQGDIPVVPDAVPDDGLLDVAVIRAHSLSDWLQVAARIGLRRRWGDVRVENFRIRTVEVRADAAHPVEYDGDVASAPLHRLTVEVRPAALTVCVPRDAPGRPARPG